MATRAQLKTIIDAIYGTDSGAQGQAEQALADYLNGTGGTPPGGDLDTIAGGDGVTIYDNGDKRVAVSSKAVVMGTNTGDPAYFSDAILNNAAAALGITGNDFDNILVGNAFANNLIGNDGNDILTGVGGNDILNGGDGNDTLNGGAGNDLLNGGSGDDSLNGGAGNDLIIINSGDEHGASETISGGDGIDEVRFASTTASDTLTLNLNDSGIERIVVGTGTGTTAVTSGKVALNVNAALLTTGVAITGNAGNNSLTGGSGNDTLDGGLGTDVMNGGAGNDTYIVDSLIEAGSIIDSAGNDTLQFKIKTAGSYTLAPGIDNVSLTGTGNILLTGNAENNILTGNAAANTFSGEDGNDSLIGGGGKDTLNGGIGNDTLDGGAGNDSMTGGSGNDTYVVNSLSDKVIEETSGGIDTILASISYSLIDTDGAGILGGNIENLTLTGSGNINGTGNDLDNILNGNSGKNILKGGGGNDTLNGGAGNDLLSGDDGDDSLNGGDGNDTLISGAGADSLQGGDGIDEVRFASTVAGDTLTLGPNDSIERIVIGTGTKATAVTSGELALHVDAALFVNDVTIIGNAGDNSLTGGIGNDTLDGGLGNDFLNGGDGDDTYIVDSFTEADNIIDSSGNDTIKLKINTAGSYILTDMENATLSGTGNIILIGNAGNNLLTGNAAANTMSGGDGDDTLDGGLGNDSMTGGDGDDTYVVNSTSDIVIEQTSGGIDTILASISYSLVDTDGAGTLGGNIENLTLIGKGNINGTGNDLDNILTGNSGKNILTGNEGNDTIFGSGNDTLFGSAGDDVLIALTGNNKLDGGAGNDTISAEMGNNTIFGGEGDDFLYARGYLDTQGKYIGPKIVINGGAGDDTILAGMSDNSGGTAERAISAVINSDDANDTIGGNDTVIFGNSFAAGAGIYTINTFRGDDTVTGADGNSKISTGFGNDTITVGNGNNTIITDEAKDTLGGADHVTVGNGKNTINTYAGDDVITIGSGVTFKTGINGPVFNTNTIDAGAGDDIIVRGLIEGKGTGSNRLYDSFGANKILGGAGNDLIDLETAENDVLRPMLDANGDPVYNKMNVIADNFYVYVVVLLDGNGDPILDGNGDVQYLAEDYDPNYGSVFVDANGDVLTYDWDTGNYITDNNIYVWDDATQQYFDGNGNVLVQDGRFYRVDINGNAILDNNDDRQYVINHTDNPVNFAYLEVDDPNNPAIAGTVIEGADFSHAKDTIDGGTGNDTIHSGGGNDSVTGGTGEDHLFGGTGNDTLDGGDDNDTIDGGAGDDLLTGGKGSDVFVIGNDNTGIDIVTDMTKTTAGTIVTSDLLHIEGHDGGDGHFDREDFEIGSSNSLGIKGTLISFTDGGSVILKGITLSELVFDADHGEFSLSKIKGEGGVYTGGSFANDIYTGGTKAVWVEG